MNKLSHLVTIGTLTLIGSSLTTNPVSAFNFSLENQTGNNFTYTITLDADESIDIGDQLILTNLSGVTAASADDPLPTIPSVNNPYSLGGFDATSANFSVNTATSGATTLTGFVSLTSTDSLSSLEYQAFFSDNGTPSVTNGNVTAVPFKPEANLAIFLLSGGFWLCKLKRKFG